MTFGSAASRRWQELRDLPGRVPLRIKLITAVLTLVAIALAAISIAGISFLRTYLLNVEDAQLRATGAGYKLAAEQCVFAGGDACGRLSPVGVAVDWVPARGKIQPVYVPVVPAGVRFRNEPPPDVAGAADWLVRHPWQTTTISATSGDHRWRMFSYPDLAASQAGPQLGTIVVGVDVTSVYNTLGRLIRIDLIVSGIVVAALAVVGVAIVRSSLRPLTDIERTAQKTASGDLTQRVPERDPRTEVGRLGSALNTMLTQIEAAFHARAASEAAARNSEERMRQFVADASHELRTPVTVIRGYAEYYRQRGGLDPGVPAGSAGRRYELPPGTPAAPESPSLRDVWGPSAPGGTPGESGASGAAGTPAQISGNGSAAPASSGAAGSGAGSSGAVNPGAPRPTDGPLGRADMDRIMERVEQESARMGGLVEDMLLLARLDQQRPIERRPIDLLTLAVDAVQDARTIAPSRTIDFTVGAGTAFLVVGDEARLRQVIGNLMSNALTHTQDGTKIEVRIRAGQRAGYLPVPSVSLEVADRGPGMTSEQANHVFERFYRADQARDRRTGGTGLGLAIVSALVTAHGGVVSLDTAPGRGATFRITLPLAPEAHQYEDADR
jgi:signal transduction histidine kinase